VVEPADFHRLSVFGLASCWLGFCSFWGLFYAVSCSPHDFVFAASDDLLTCSKKVAVKVSFVFVVWKETCKLGWPGCSITLQPNMGLSL
jgi:hypothetical protein